MKNLNHYLKTLGTTLEPPYFKKLKEFFIYNKEETMTVLKEIFKEEINLYVLLDYKNDVYYLIKDSNDKTLYTEDKNGVYINNNRNKN